MASKNTIVYSRNTTYTFDHVYQKNGVNSNDGLTLLFTVKKDQYDTVANDSSAIIKKSIAMSGATTVVTIDPGDIPDSLEPNDYFFDIKVIESYGPPPVIIQCTQGTFTLEAYATNREAA